MPALIQIYLVNEVKIGQLALGLPFHVFQVATTITWRTTGKYKTALEKYPRSLSLKYLN